MVSGDSTEAVAAPRRSACCADCQRLAQELTPRRESRKKVGCAIGRGPDITSGAMEKILVVNDDGFCAPGIPLPRPSIELKAEL
jgi:hypothetical protein